MKKALIICGPTATGKTSLALKLAKKYNGEIISADSRQIYKGMDIGTGKDLAPNSRFNLIDSSMPNFDVGFYLINKIPVWLLDIVNPSQSFNLFDWLSCAELAVKEIIKKEKLVIFVGGTGLYLKYLLEKFDTSSSPANKSLRKELGLLSKEILKEKLISLDKNVFNLMNHSDQNNPRRLIRKIEILSAGTSLKNKAFNLLGFDVFQVGLWQKKEIINKRVGLRVKKRLDQGLIKEIKALFNKGYSWSDPGFNTLAYKEFELFFLKEKSLKESINRWQLDEEQYVKRQLTWFKKEKNINWFNFDDPELITKVVNEINRWYI